MHPPIPVAVHGAAGRMGQAVLRTLGGCDDLSLIAALVRADSGLVGQPLISPSNADGPGLRYATVLASDITAKVLIDFSVADAFDQVLAFALDHELAFVSGTTGLDTSQRAALERAAKSIPVLWSANFSLGVALLSRLVGEAARALPDWDCEIAEAHHSRKRDAPSGTALALGREVAAARGNDFEAVAALARCGEDVPRAPGSIGFAAIRAGDIVGEHSVLFATSGERIELVHRATDRDIFARGAVAAARWIADRPPGRYALADVIAV